MDSTSLSISTICNIIIIVFIFIDIVVSVVIGGAGSDDRRAGCEGAGDW